MKFLSIFLVFVFLFGCTATTVEEKNPIEGTWELISSKTIYTDTTIIGLEGQDRQIKMISRTHFVWISQDTSRYNVSGFGGGRYTLNGDNFTEHIDMFIAPYWVGKSVPYKIKIEGDTFIQSGTVPYKEWGFADSDYKTIEVWKRID